MADENVLVKRSSLDNIANAIRSKNGTTNTYLPSEMAQAVQNIPTGGGDEWHGMDFETFVEMRSTLTSYVDEYGEVENLISAAFTACHTLKTVSFPNCTTIGDSAFANCTNLTTASFPNCTTIRDSVFQYCSYLTTISFPNCTTIGNSAFAQCYRLTTVSFPNCATVRIYAFASCSKLTTASFPKCTVIRDYAFRSCYNLISLYLMNNTVADLLGSAAFGSTPIGGYSTSAGQYGSIFVPASLLANYKAATNWSYFSSRFVGV